MSSHAEYILTLSCPDRPGVVAAVSGLLAGHGCNIIESQQFGDRAGQRFFMRVQFSGPLGEDELNAAFAALAADFAMEFKLRDVARKPRVLIMVSKFDHCLNDLLYRVRSKTLDIEIVAVASNHPDLRPLTQSYGIDYHHLPIAPGAKARQEAEVLTLVEHYQVDLVVLARYMQVLSEDLCEKLAGRAINIHHSFLPSFKGAKPYHQAHDRGVKLIGATAHYVTEELDAGPIIEQDVIRVSHRDDVKALTRLGADIERAVLARAVQWHCEDRVLRHGDTTVVFQA
jgi:formyltetrahydrofolate deformylase